MKYDDYGHHFDEYDDHFDEHDDHFYDFDHFYAFDHFYDNTVDHYDHWNCLTMHARYVIITMTSTNYHDSGS